jgi:hypothetical protein
LRVVYVQGSLPDPQYASATDVVWKGSLITLGEDESEFALCLDVGEQTAFYSTSSSFFYYYVLRFLGKHFTEPRHAEYVLSNHDMYVYIHMDIKKRRLIHN